MLNQQKEELQSTVHQLKNTQAQLIQAEKLASLGELTALLHNHPYDDEKPSPVPGIYQGHLQNRPS